jgi:cellulose synthase (UDP-forming)
VDRPTVRAAARPLQLVPTGADAARHESHAVPPTDAEKYSYLRGSQRRWIFPVQTAAFAGVAASLAGFAANATWTLVFYLPLIVYAVEQALALRTSTYPRRVTLQQLRAAIARWRPESHPSVDVFLPTAGEATELLENTYRYVKELRWPARVRVYVLDDAGRREVRSLAESFGFVYLARTTHEFKKAGNLKYGTDRSDGDLVAIFDADFVPRADFLTELVPYFDDPTVGIVQSPQYFGTSRRMNWEERAAGATQEMFYRFIQPSRDSVGAAICVGSCAVYRRTALEAIGGFPQVGHSEDVFTGVLMSRSGYRLRYVPVVVSKGICPDGINTFITQQYRWCEGSMRLLTDDDFHVEQSMTLRQRMCFWSGFLYYVSTAVTVFLAPLPVIVMAVWFPSRVFAINMSPLLGALVLWFVIYPLLFRARWRLEVLRVQALYSFAHALSIVHLLKGRTAEWVPSHGSDRSRATSVAATVRLVSTTYILASQGLLLVLLTARSLEYGVTHYWATDAFALVYAVVLLPVAGEGLAGMRRERLAARTGAKHGQAHAERAA